LEVEAPRVLVLAEAEDFRTVRDLLAAPDASDRHVQRASTVEAARRAAGEEAFDAALAFVRTADEAREVLAGLGGDWALPLVVIAPAGVSATLSEAPPEAVADVLGREDLTPALLERCLRHAVERRRMQQALREARERLDLLARATADGLWEWDLRTDRFVCSERWRAIAGCSEEDLGGGPETWLGRVHPEDADRVRAQLEAHIAGRTPRFQDQHRLRDGEGRYRWVLCRALARRDAEGRALALVGTLTDVHAAHEAQEQLRRDAFHDTLTGLPNRAVFTDRLGRCIERAKRRGDYLFAVLFLDLDRLKAVNDSLGHAVGDQLLVAVARRLEVCLRATDTVARLSGDEFAVLLEELRDGSDALRVTERVQANLQRPFNLGGHEIFTSASVGIVLSTGAYTDPEQVLRDADIAMYRAKSRGRGRHEMFDRTQQGRARRRLCLESGLHRALEREEFEVHYQPIVALNEARRVAGLEALVRWRHPERGLLLPAEFLPVAEEMGLIIELDRWVLRRACRQLRAWHDRFPARRDLYVSVNFSRKQLAREDLPDTLRDCLDEAGLEPQHVRPEITESEILADRPVAERTLRRLRELHVLLHMDDFGTGYSSLSHLVHARVDTLKIDGAFVRNLPARGESFEIVRMAVSLAHNLGMSVIAEGVETEAQCDELRHLRCEFAQGFLFSEPLDAEAAEAYLARGGAP